MFVPCIIRRSRNDQHYALICTTPLFYILAPTYFGSILPSSGSFLDPSELLKIEIEWLVYHIMCGYVACVLDCRGSVCCASQHTLYDIPPIRFVFQVTQKEIRSSLLMAGYCRNMYKPVYRIKKWYNQCIVLVISTKIAILQEIVS
jgi:hypothetical protein